ncbi:unnamed protein product [Adineta steineri]|uniref:Uncharacterized protein n=1 Tax=Adineta steineri TaxID=433720 RepID=A0A814STC1_9BILA|nr:unnamed protein product [Adineta steineri]CAF1149823.1 unnamed protein product [Adineta steineri]CAF1151587.1 unnamed protein product [Adineta steineri]
MSLFTLIFATPISTEKPPSIIDSLSQLLYTHLNPIFQNTLQQLIELVFKFGERIFENIQSRLARSAPPIPAQWVQELFGEVNSVATQWNQHVTQFFSNIPTIFEKHGRSSINFSSIKQSLYDAIASLLDKLKKLFVNDINQIFILLINKYNLMESMSRTYNDLLNVFQQQVSSVFDKSQEQLIDNINIAINFIVSLWNDVKTQLIG